MSRSGAREIHSIEREREDQSGALRPLRAGRNGRGLSPATWISDAAGSRWGLPGSPYDQFYDQ